MNDEYNLRTKASFICLLVCLFACMLFLYLYYFDPSASVASIPSSASAVPMPFEDVMASIGKGPDLKLSAPRDYTREQWVKYEMALKVHKLAEKKKDEKENRIVDSKKYMK